MHYELNKNTLINMKRILSILTALMLFCMGWVENANAQPDVAGRTFTLQCARGYVYYNGSVLAGTANAADASEFAIVTYSGVTFLYDATTKRFVYNTNLAHSGGTGNPLLESNSDLSKAVTGLTWNNTGDATYPYFLDDYYNNRLNMDGTPRVYMNGWKTGDAGNKYQVAIVNAAFDDTEALSFIESYYSSAEVAICDNTITGFDKGKGTFVKGTSFTSNLYSGYPGLVLTTTTATNRFDAADWNSVRNMTLKPTNANGYYRLIMTAPTGYVITGYEVGGYCYEGPNTYTLKSESGVEGEVTITSTDFSGSTPSLIVSGLSSSSTYFQFKATDKDKWLAIPWFKVYLTRTVSPSDLSDGAVYSLSCVYSDGSYPIFNNGGTPGIATTTTANPQLFVLRTSATTLTDANLYNLQKAEGDGKYLAFDSATGKENKFDGTPSDYLFLNSGSTLPDGATWYSSTKETDPYTGFYGYYVYDGTNRYPAFRGTGSNTLPITAQDGGTYVNNKIYGNTTYRTRNQTGTGIYNYRWILKPEPYKVYNLVVQDAGGTAVNDAMVRYYNPNDATIEHATQQNGGFFVIKNSVTPVQWMFSLDNSPTYKVTGFALSGTTITVTVVSTATTTITEGRYHLWNCGRNAWLVQYNDALNRISNFSGLGVFADVWEVVPTAVSGQYFIRNEADGRYLAEAAGNTYTLVESAADAARVTFSSAAGTGVSDKGYENGCVAILNSAVASSGRNHFQMSTGGYIGWYYESWEGQFSNNDWLIYPAETFETGTEYLILNTRSGKYATRVDDATQMTQKAKGAVEGTNSVWTLSASGEGYKMANGGTTNLLASVSSFTAEGITWYIKPSPYNALYYSISSDIDPTTRNCWNDGSQTYVTTYYGNDAGSCWRFITVEAYYQNALAYLECLYDVAHKDDLFYISEAAYNSLTTAAHSTSAEKIAAANAMYNVLSDYSSINMPENGKDYLIMNVGLNVIYRQERYVYTDASKMVLADTPYNSSYFWHIEKDGVNAYALSQCCYGTTGGEYPSADKRYIAGTQPAQGSGTNWQYTNVKPTNSLSFQLYATNEIPFFGTASMIVDGNRMNGSGYNVITWNAQDNNCKWKLITVEEASASLIATAETAVAVARANAGAAFTLTAEVIDDIEDAIEALESTPTYVNYYILEQLLKDHTNYYWLANGRYLVRNYEFDPDGDGNVNDTETYLTSLINPEGVVEDAICYWSIWDITNVGLGQYQVVNEGNKYILAPGGQLDGDPNTDERNDGYLFYDTTKNAYQVGDPTVSDESTLYFYPAAEVSAILPASDVVSGDFAAISVPSQVAQGKYMNMFTASDHVASYSTTPTSRKGCFWQFIPINSQNETNHEGTHSGEAEMFANQVNGLAGYVGGVVTLENVESVPCLNDIVLLRNATVKALDDGTALNFTNVPYEAVNVNQNDNVGAKAFRAILDRIHDIKDGKEPDGTTNNELKKYYQDLRPTEVINEANVYHPFFLENMSGQRPEFGARLAQTSETGYWRCVRQVEANDNLSVFYVRRNGAVGDNATYWLRNGEKTGVGNFLKHGTMSQNDEVEYVAHNATDSNGDGIPDDALEFKIDPVIPGVWQMRDVSDGNETGGSRYLTITGTGPTISGHNYTIQYYNKSETSTLWKFKTFNDLDKIYLRPGPETGGMNFFCTFSYPLNITLPKAGNPTPYYCSAAYHSRGGTNAALKVVFEVVPDDGTNYYLKGNEGYMFMSEDATGLNIVNDASDEHNGYVYIDDAQFLSGGIPTTLLPNSMKANLNTTYVTSENWARIYALGNVSTSTQVGSYHGTPVYGIGMGFYHVKIGGKLNPNTAYIPRERFTGVDDEELPSYSIKEMSESGIPAEIVFKDEYGNIVDQIEVLPDGTMQRTADGPVYDLAGRRVTKPTHGIYIQNGRKVMYK